MDMKAETGFSLIEVLITLLILAIGLMGVAALQFRGLQYNQDAYTRSQVNVLLYDIADRMRLNSANVANYVSNYTVTVDTAANDCDNTVSSDKDNDLGCWHNSVDRALPPGSTAVITAAGSLYTATLSWNDRDGTNHSIDTTIQVGR